MTMRCRPWARVVGSVAVALLLGTLLGCESVSWKGTPFDEMSARNPDRVNLWPIFYHTDQATSVLWPVGEKTDDHFAVRPFYSVYKLNRPQHEYNVLWPLAQFDYDAKDYRVFPAFWGSDAYAKYFHVIPLFFSAKHRDSPRTFTVFPLFWYQRNDHFALFPLFINRAKERDTHVLWPIFNVRRGEEHGWRVWPLFGQYAEQDKRYRYLLWPLIHEYSRPGERWRIAAPLYFSEQKKDRGWNLLLPFFFRAKSPTSSLLWITPLYSAGREGEAKQWRLLVPIFFDDRRGEGRLFMAPLFGFDKSGSSKSWIATPLLSAYTHSGPRRKIWALAPLIHARWGEGHAASHVFPLYLYDGAKRRFLSLPISQWSYSGGRATAVLGPLFVYNSEKNRRQWYFPWPLMSGYREDGSVGGWLGPFYYRNRGGKAWRFYAPWPLISGFRKGRKDSPSYSSGSWFWPVYKYKQWRYKPDDKFSSDFWILGWLYDWERHPVRRESTTATVEAEEYVRSRILWRVMRYERQGARSSLDVFPFIAYDRHRDTGYRKFSFVWRLFRYERGDDGKVNADLLFIPIARP